MLDIYLIQLDIFIVVPMRFYLISAHSCDVKSRLMSIYCLDLYIAHGIIVRIELTMCLLHGEKSFVDYRSYRT